MITIGADPEVFLVDNNNSPVSSIGKIGGTKEHPIPIRDGIFLQEDNVTVEYNIPPCQSAQEFLKANTDALQIIQERAKKLNLNVSIQASHKMPKQELEDPRAWVFGCEPDFNVHDMDWNPKPNISNLRAAGGHIHIGFEGENTDKIILTKHLDLTLGALFSYLDPDKRRKQMYGRAGSIRFKPYGIEYRTLSNFWLTHPYYIKTVFDTTHTLVQQNDDELILQYLLNNTNIQAINKRTPATLRSLLKTVLTTYVLPQSFINTATTALEAPYKNNTLDYEFINKTLNTFV